MSRRIEELHAQITKLEEQLAQACADYSELHHLFSPFLARYQAHIVPYHEKLVEVKRENADLRAMLGQRDALEAQVGETPLTKLLDDKDLSVTEQYKRAWSVSTTAENTSKDIKPVSTELWKLYVAVIPKVFPAFGDTEEEIDRRLSLFKRANFAFVKRDRKVLQAILDSHAQKMTTLPAVVDPNMADKLRDQSIKLEKAITNIEGQVFEMRYGRLGKLKQAVDEAKVAGRDLIKELKRELRTALRDAVEERERLRKMMNS